MRPHNFALQLVAGVLTLAVFAYGAHVAPAGHVVRSTSAGAVASQLDESERPMSRATTLEARRRISMQRPGTYIDDILRSHDSTIARWHDRTAAPVRVWIQDASDLAEWNAACIHEVQSAFEEWSATGIPVRFTFVDQQRDAEVTVKWISKFGEPISGKTVWTRDDSWWIVAGRLTLALHRGNGEPLSIEAVHAIALHEVGHLLGLDHATSDANIMAAKVRVPDLSVADKATMRLLYSIRPGALALP